MTKLSVNLNKIALLRNSRGSNYPNLLEFAERCTSAGVAGLTVHPRPDERHITRKDAYDLATYTRDLADIEYNIEGNPTDAFLAMVYEIKPDQCTLVPDSPEQLTSDHGWDALADDGRLKQIVTELQNRGIRVSVFMDPVIEQIEAVAETGAERIELYTEEFAKFFGTDEQLSVFSRYHKAATSAQSLGLGVNAGHDLNLQNLSQFLTIPDVLEVSIGHAIMVESFDYGYDQTLKKYLEIVNRSS